jgi:hypothetical protein
VVQLDRLLDPPPAPDGPHPTPQAIQAQVRSFLTGLEEYAQRHPAEARVVTHVCQTVRERWPRLFACYAWPERYRTNNALETFFSRLRTRQRQIQGRKFVHAFLLRYGEWAVYVDPAESVDELVKRFRQFDQAEYDRESARFRETQQRLQVLYRFRHHPQRCLRELEQQWADAVQHSPNLL